MNRKKIVLVEYFNTEPFVEGLQGLSDKYELVRKIPAECTAYYKSGEADIALIPVASFFEMPDSRRITNYGIGCDGRVKTVMILSQSPIKEINKIYLDDHSRTSVQLCRIIIEQFWNLEVTYERTAVSDIELQTGEAVLMIGDKVFDQAQRFKYHYDLGEIWKEETGLPFVFAVWVTRNKMSVEDEQELNEHFDFGLSQLEGIIKKLPDSAKIDFKEYFENDIRYEINEDGIRAIEEFRKYMNVRKSNPLDAHNS